MSVFFKHVFLIAAMGAVLPGLAASDDGNQQSSYPSTLVENGRARFVAACGFCHGRDAAGGSRGLDLIRSELVARDVDGDLIGDVVRRGRPDTDMPAFATAVIGNADLQAIVAFIHNQRLVAETLEGGRRSVAPEDIAVGNAVLGKIYFDDNCSRCHAADGDLAGIASRLQGLPLMMRMLYPGSERRGGSRPPVQVTVITADGTRLSGALAYRDGFTVAMLDEAGNYRSWRTKAVNVIVNDPLQAHADQLVRYTDDDMHNVLAYLLSLK